MSVGNAAMKKSGSGVITGFSKDSVPAGIRATNASHLTIYGNGFGTLKGDVLMKDANQANYFVALHPTHNILYWSDDSIQIIVPSMGFASNGDEFLGDTRSACAGTGYIRVIRGTGSPIPIWSDTIPYAINNFATNSAFENLYTPHELRLHNANGQGGYTFIYDTEFFTNKPAYNAFHRALDTWRKYTGLRFTEVCGEVACQDATANQVAVYF